MKALGRDLCWPQRDWRLEERELTNRYDPAITGAGGEACDALMVARQMGTVSRRARGAFSTRDAVTGVTDRKLTMQRRINCSILMEAGIQSSLGKAGLLSAGVRALWRDASACPSTR